MIRTQTRDHVLEITIDRPEAMNALSPEMSRQLSQALADYEADDSLRVALITGAGDRAFCAGADLGRMEQSLQGREIGDGAARDLPPFWEMDLTKPLIAAVNGHCLAAGLGLALLCDVRVASDNATFGAMGTLRGIVPGAGQTQRLPRLVGLSNAMWLLLSADRIDAAEALRIGLVNKVTSPEQLLAIARRWTDMLAERAPLAVRAAKKAAIEGLELPLGEGLRLEAELSSPVRRSEDAAEGIRAFHERRAPRFRGR
jgi:E-phenylitaconyl-CoA hydratase